MNKQKMSTKNTPLSNDERKRLAELEAVVDIGMDELVRMPEAQYQAEKKDCAKIFGKKDGNTIIKIIEARRAGYHGRN
jgi:hypothetical protein